MPSTDLASNSILKFKSDLGMDFLRPDACVFQVIGTAYVAIWI